VANLKVNIPSSRESKQTTLNISLCNLLFLKSKYLKSTYGPQVCNSNSNSSLYRRLETFASTRQRLPQQLLQLFNSCTVILRSLRCLSLRNVNVLCLNLDFLANGSDLVSQCPSFQFERRINRGLDLVRDLGHDVLELNLWSQYFPTHTSIHRLCIMRQYRQALRFGCRRQTWLWTFSLRRKQRWQGRSTMFTTRAALALALMRRRDLARA
jgi:hypothetical protein